MMRSLEWEEEGRTLRPGGPHAPRQGLRHTPLLRQARENCVHQTGGGGPRSWAPLTLTQPRLLPLLKGLWALCKRSQLATWEEGCPGNRSPGGPWTLGALPGASVSNVPRALSHLTTEHPCSAERRLVPGTGHTGFLPAGQSGGQQDSIGAPGGSGDARVCMELPGETLSTTARDVLKGNGCSLSLEGKTLPAPK